MDAALRQIMKEFPALLLIGPTKKKEAGSDNDQKGKSVDSNSGDINDKDQQMEAETVDTETGTDVLESSKCPQAESEADVNSVPPSIIHAISTILRFLSTLLKHAMQKSLFNLSDKPDPVQLLSIGTPASLSVATAEDKILTRKPAGHQLAVTQA